MWVTAHDVHRTHKLHTRSDSVILLDLILVPVIGVAHCGSIVSIVRWAYSTPVNDSARSAVTLWQSLVPGFTISDWSVLFLVHCCSYMQQPPPVLNPAFYALRTKRALYWIAYAIRNWTSKHGELYHSLWILCSKPGSIKDRVRLLLCMEYIQTSLEVV